MLEYFSYLTAKKHQESAPKSENPVLNDEDEQFLQRIASEGTPPPLPQRPIVINEGSAADKEAQTALMDGAQNVPLPETPDEPTEKGKETEKKKFSPWTYLQRDTSKKDRENTAADLSSLTAALKAGENPNAEVKEDGTTSEKETTKEEEDMTIILDKLNLAAVNNRVFSISKESQELLQKFNLILKDLMNGVPTAYDDLEALLTNSEGQLKSMFGHMPPFLQSLIRSLPSKMTTSLAPEILAAAAEKQGFSTASTGVEAEASSQEGSSSQKKKKSGLKIPSLKSLVTQQGAVAGMLRSIMNFLRLRWPAFMGSSNILLSLALFVLLFVFWYCHKRGRETRLTKEQAEALGETYDPEASDLEASIADLAAEKPAEGETEKEPEAEEKKDVEASEPDISAIAAAASAPMPAEVPLPADESVKAV